MRLVTTLRLLTLTLLMLASSAGTALSTPVTWVYEGNVHAIPYFPTIAEGTLLRFQWTFDSDQQNLCHVPNQGTYFNQSAVVDLGPYRYQAQGILVTNAHFFSGCGAGLYPSENELRLFNWSGSLLPNANGDFSTVWPPFQTLPPGFFWFTNYGGAFPPTPPLGGTFYGPEFIGPRGDGRFGVIGFGGTAMRFVQEGPFHPVPEPATVVLLGAGASALLMRRRKNRSLPIDTD